MSVSTPFHTLLRSPAAAPQLLRALALGTAVAALGGCSWLPIGGKSAAPAHFAGPQAAGGQFAGGQFAGGLAGGQFLPASACQIPHAQAPIPAGCNPASVTIGLGGFSQQPQFGSQFGGSQFGGPVAATAAFGAGVGNVAPVNTQLGGRFERPSRLRGFASLGVEKSFSGDYLDFSRAGVANPALDYDPRQFRESSRTVIAGDPISESVEASFFAEVESVEQPNISFDDVYSTPLSIRGGVEYFVSPRASVFANAGYTYAEGNGGPAAVVNGTLVSERNVQFLDEFLNVVPGPGSGISTVEVPNVRGIASFDYNFTDLRQLDLEAGGRLYFEPLKKVGLDRVSPFVAASAGATRHNAQGFTVTQRQAFLEQSFNNDVPAAERTQGNTFEVVPAAITGGNQVELYDSQWTARGSLNAGVEWQATPRTAIAFETGVNIVGGRDYAATGEGGDANVSVPFTIRGSFNF